MQWLQAVLLALQIIKLVKELEKGKDANTDLISSAIVSAIPAKATKDITPEDKALLQGSLTNVINLFLKDN